MFRRFNPNSCGAYVDDCSVRAICAACNLTWDSAYNILCDKGFYMCNMPSSKAVVHAVLRSLGFHQFALPNDIPDKYTLIDFCLDHPRGTFIVALDNHIVTVINGEYYDAWNSGDEYPLYYFYKE